MDKKKRECPEYFEDVKDKEKRKLRAKQRKKKNIWLGFKMFGLVGWSVAVPTVIGAVLGARIDSQLEGAYSWTVMLIFIGLCIGCLNAWYWVKREGKFTDGMKENDDNSTPRV